MQGPSRIPLNIIGSAAPRSGAFVLGILCFENWYPFTKKKWDCFRRVL